MPFGKQADGVTFIDVINRPSDGFSIGGRLGDGESAPPFEEFAEESPVKQLSAGHEVEKPRAPILNKNRVSIGHMVGENKKWARFGDVFGTSPPHGGAKTEKEAPSESAEEGIDDTKTEWMLAHLAVRRLNIASG